MSSPDNDSQTVQQPSSSENPTKPVGMLTYFWWTILALISVTVVLLILATINQDSQPEKQQRVRTEQGKESPRAGENLGLRVEERSPRPEEYLRKQAKQRMGPILRELRPESFEKTANTIDEQIDLAFEPIYDQIPKLLNWHYSVPGQYEQLGKAAFGYLESEMEERLFSGIYERLKDASTKINETFKAEFDSLISQKIKDETQAVDNASRDVYEKMLTKVMQNSIQRFTASVPGSGVTAFQGAIAGKALFGTITKTMSKKLFASVVIKTSGKIAAKMAGAGGAAASGAVVGAFLGPGGAVVGGVVGGIVGWVAVDAVVVTIDKHFNRDDFEQELVTLIDKRKDEVKSLMREAKSKKLEELSKTLDNVPPSQM